MCDPTSMFIVSTGIAAGGQIAGGLASNAAGKRAARSYETQRIQVATQTSQESRDRMADYDKLQASNDIAVAFSGLDAVSFAAVNKANRRDEAKDIERIIDQGAARQSDARAAGAEARAAGRNRLIGSLFGAAGTAVGGYQTYQQTKTLGSLVKLGE